MTAAVGRLIAQRRRELGMSQRELAERLCAETGRPTITRHELSRYERGTRIPGRQVLSALTSILNSPQSHPPWCVQGLECTAFDPVHPVQAHRSAPIVVDTDDQTVKIHLHASATPDGGHLSIEITETGRSHQGVHVTAALLAEVTVASRLAPAVEQILDQIRRERH